MQIIENRCVNCPDGCRNCGADRTPVTVCDNCGSPDRHFWHHEDDPDEQLCLTCAVERAAAEFAELSDREKLELMNYKEGTV